MVNIFYDLFCYIYMSPIWKSHQLEVLNVLNPIKIDFYDLILKVVGQNTKSKYKSPIDFLYVLLWIFIIEPNTKVSSEMLITKSFYD